MCCSTAHPRVDELLNESRGRNDKSHVRMRLLPLRVSLLAIFRTNILYSKYISSI